MKVFRYSNMTITHRIKRKVFLSAMLTIMLFLYCINFHSLIIGLIFFAIVMIRYFLIRREKLQINLLPITLAIFTIMYSSFSYYYNYISILGVVSFALIPIAFYFVGVYAIKEESIVKSLFYYIYLVIFSLFIFGILCVGKTIYYDGISSLLIGARKVSVPWSDIQFNATNIGAYFAMGLSLSGIVFTFSWRRLAISIKLLSVLILVLSIMSVLFLGNRIGLVIIASSFLAVYFICIIYGFTQNKNKAISNFLIISTLLFIAYIIQSNIFGVGEKMLGSTLVIRLSESNLLEDLRFIAWREAFVGLFEYPFGGKQANIPLNYAHNLWLDVGYTTGLIPFIILLFFSFFALKDFVKLIKSKVIPIELKALLTGVYVSIFINFFVEPILDGYFIQFTIFCFIVGMINKYIRLIGKVTIQKPKKVVYKINENTLVRQHSTS